MLSMSGPMPAMGIGTALRRVPVVIASALILSTLAVPSLADAHRSGCHRRRWPTPIAPAVTAGIVAPPITGLTYAVTWGTARDARTTNTANSESRAANRRASSETVTPPH
jgi:hypothetical protein